MAANVLAAAREYAKLGWRVFPILAVTQTGGCECGNAECDKAGKHPAVKEWNKVATTNIKQIEAWWGERPDRGVGIATGEASGITVLDVDGEDGVEALAGLAGGSGVPPSPCVQSRPGRYHYYFNYKDGVRSNSGKIGPKLDARNNGGYVVAPPSRHASGGIYTWLQHPSKVTLSDWPEFLSDKKAKSKAGRPSKETFNPANPLDIAKLTEALAYLDPDDEERWSQVGWIMGRAFGRSDGGFAIYRPWAAGSRKFNEKRTKAHYYDRSKEVRGSDLKTTSSIYAWALEGGWDHKDEEELEEREFHVFENPYREEKMVHDFVAAASAAPRIFVMDKRLIRIVHYGTSGANDAAIDRDPTAYVVWEHDTDTLAVELGNVAAFWAKTPKGEFRRAGFSRQSLKTFMNCREYQTQTHRIKPLVAFVPHATLRANGSLLTKVGYDPESRLFLTESISGLDVNANLTREAAKKAMGFLLEPFDEYPWASAVDRAVFVAALFTVGLRHLFDVAPLFAFSSPKHGSGKTQLAECLSRLWYGITLSKATWTPNPEEMEKRIAAFLLAGDRMVCLDNVTEGLRLEDSTLNKVLTSRRNTFRLLGKTERIELTNEATWFATGNQLMLAGDISRRALVCYIDARVVDPSSRRFTIANLPAHIMKHRAELMSSALSIVASWMQSGRPQPKVKGREYGSFTDWYALIRPLLLWAGEADLEAGIKGVVEEDSEGMALEMFANVLRATFPPDGSALAVLDVLKLFHNSTGLRAAFQGCMRGHDREPNVYSISTLLRSCENKIFINHDSSDKFTFAKTRDRAIGVWRWGVEDRNES